MTANGYGWSADARNASTPPWHLYTKAQLGTNAAGLSCGMVGGWYFVDAIQADVAARRCYLPAATYVNGQVPAAIQLDPGFNLQLFSTFGVPAHPAITLQRTPGTGSSWRGSSGQGFMTPTITRPG